MALPAVDPEYDIIFAGGGTTASIAASRLISKAPNLRILLLEAGPTTKDKPEHVQPGQYLLHLAPTTTTVVHHIAKTSEFLGGRASIVPTGGCVGGGSSINFSVYNRPAMSDFDHWETEYKNPGWGAKDLIPLLQDIETYEIDPNAPTHGSSGPLRVSYGGAFSEHGKQFLQIAPKYDKRRLAGTEANAFDEKSINVFTRWPKWIGKDGRRSDVGHYFLYTESSKNLTIAHGARVKRVIIEGNVATGVEFVFDKAVHPNAPQDVHTVRAAKLVVVSAGSLGSPLILERSGVGSPEILKAAGVTPIIDLPGVGDNYHDHLFVVVPYLTDPEIETYDALWRGDKDEWAKQTAQWNKDGTGLLANNGIDAAIKIRPFPDELPEFGPAFNAYWKEQFENYPDRPLALMGALAGFPTDHSELPPLHWVSAGYFTGYPASRGAVHIASNDVYTPPDFDAGFLSHPSDIEALRWLFKKSREIVRRLPLYRGAFSPIYPAFAEDSLAAPKGCKPADLSEPDIVYSEADDKAIDEFHRAFVNTTWHSLGTCAMKPRESGGVVDSRLNVYGVRNLKVADVSIPPSNVHSNTCSTAMVIGEKAALIIAEDIL